MKINLKKLGKQAKHYDYVLLMMRHARAESANDGGDEQRDLTEKGKKQAKKMAKGLTGMDVLPDRIACSSAVRAEHTLERMLRIFGDHPKIDYRQNLYDHGIDAVMEELSATKHKVRTLMVLGHEPTMSLACQWIANPEDSGYGVLSLGLSPASVVMLGSDKPFAQWSEHAADIIAVLNPDQIS